MNFGKSQIIEENTLKPRRIQKYVFDNKTFPVTLQFAFEFYLIWISIIMRMNTLAFHNMKSIFIIYSIFM